MITHRAKLRRLAFISCPWSAAYADTTSQSVPANRGGFTSPVTANVGSGTLPAKGTRRVTALLRYFVKVFLRCFGMAAHMVAVRRPDAARRAANRLAGARSTTIQSLSSVTSAPASVRRSREVLWRIAS